MTEHEIDPTTIVEAPAKAIVTTAGAGLSVVSSGLTKLPQLSPDMPPEERRTAVREVLKHTIDMPDRLDVWMGEMLYEVKVNDYWKEWTGEFGVDRRPYASFEEYAEIELSIKRRKAYYLVKIYEKFVIELGLAPSILHDLEWSKAKEVVEIITADNWADILEKLKHMSVAEIKVMVREMTGKIPTASESSGLVKRTFALHVGQVAVVDSAIALAKTMTGSDKDGFALEMVCTDFMCSMTGSGLEGALSRLDVAIKNIEAAFGVTVKVEKVDTERYTRIKEAAAAKPEETPVATAGV